MPNHCHSPLTYNSGFLRLQRTRHRQSKILGLRQHSSCWEYPSLATTGLEFWLRNDCNKGRSIDFSRKYQLISADNFDSWKTAEPKRLHFYGRWGRSTNKVTLSRDSMQGIIKAAVGPVVGSVLSAHMVTDIATYIAAQFRREDQDGPRAPIAKSNWNGSE